MLIGLSNTTAKYSFAIGTSRRMRNSSIFAKRKPITAAYPRAGAPLRIRTSKKRKLLARSVILLEIQVDDKTKTVIVWLTNGEKKQYGFKSAACPVLSKI